jgi:conjugal transfer pilus assembly protein TraI
MISWFSSLFGSRRQTGNPIPPMPSAAPVAAPVRDLPLPMPPDVGDPLADVPRYPPYDSGIPLKDWRLIVESQRELITRIFKVAGVSRDEFAAHYQPAIDNLARFVHLLPATSQSNHRGAGGLFRFSLEIALHGLQSANAAVFPSGGGVDRRYAMQPKWMLGTFLAGACSQLYRTVNNMVIVDPKNHQWQPLIIPLSEWARGHGAQTFFIRWNEDLDSAAAQAASAYLVNHIVRPETLQYLSDDNNLVVPAMSGAITGTTIGNNDNPIARVVIPVVTRVIDSDARRSPINYGHHQVGMHLEPHLIDAMRRLIRMGVWAVNSKRSNCLWLGKDGAYLNWPPAANDVANLMLRDHFAGVPREADTLAEMLIRAEILEPKSKKDRYWSILAPDSGEVIDTALKLRHREILFDASFDFSPYDTTVLSVDSGQPKATAQSAQTAKAATDSGPAQRDLALPVPERMDPPGPSGTLAAPPGHQPASTSGSPAQSKVDPVAPDSNTKVPPRAGEGQAASNAPERPKKAADKKDRANAPSPSSREKDSVQPQQGSADVAAAPSANKVLQTLSGPNAAFLSELVTIYNTGGKRAGPMAWLEQGFGISDAQVTSLGLNVVDLITELQVKQWLYVDKTKPSRTMHLIEHQGKQVRWIVLKEGIARQIGFTES